MPTVPDGNSQDIVSVWLQDALRQIEDVLWPPLLPIATQEPAVEPDHGLVLGVRDRETERHIRALRQIEREMGSVPPDGAGLCPCSPVVGRGDRGPGRIIERRLIPSRALTEQAAGVQQAPLGVGRVLPSRCSLDLPGY